MKATGSRPTPRNLFSFSRVKTFHQCRRRYRYRYLEGLAEAFRSIESFVGQTVHATLEWLYRERDDGRAPDLVDAHAVLAADWGRRWGDDVALVRTGDDVTRYRGDAQQMVEQFYHGVFERDRSATLALEQRLSLALEDGVQFTGVVDRIGRTEAGRLFVIDYKTTRAEGNSSDFSEGLQAPLYAACTLERHGEPEAMAGYHYLRHGTTSWHRIDQQRGRLAMARFHQLATEAATATDFPATPGPLCAWCGFNAICPDARVPEHLAGGQRMARARLVPGGDPRPDPPPSRGSDRGGTDGGR